MKLIVAADKNWAIGKNGRMLVSIPEDMKLFMEDIKDGVLVMGRKTYSCIREKSVITGKVNFVLSKNKKMSFGNCIVCESVDELLEKTKDYDTNDIIVAGGAQVIRELLPYCTEAHITRINYSYDADVYMPNLDKDDNWKITAESEEKTYFNIVYRFVKYERTGN